MAIERIDVQVTDKVAASIAKKMEGIAAGAEKGYNWVVKLQKALSALPSTALEKLSSAATTATADVQKTSAAVSVLEQHVRSMTSATNQAVSSLRTMESAQKGATNAAATANRTMTESVTKTQQVKKATDDHSASLGRMGNQSKMAGHHTANLVAQINDIGVSLASGQNPMLVFIQQGSQLQNLAMQVDGGFKTLIATTLRLAAPFAAVAIVVGVLVQKFADFKKELNDDSGLKAYAQTLGLTKKELKELEDQSVTSMDIIKGAWMTVKEALPIDAIMQGISDAFHGTIDFIWNNLKQFTFETIAIIKGTYQAIITIWKGFPAAFGDIFAQAINGAIGLLEGLANKTIDVLNSLGGSFEHVTLKRMENANAGSAAKMGSDITGAYNAAYKEAETNYNAFVKRVAQNSEKVARDRLKSAAQKIIEDRPEGRTRKPREDHTAENRAHALAQVNLQLDNELSRMKLLKDERVIQQRMDQIEQSLAQKKITLNDAEKASILGKITAIQEYARIQQEMDRIITDLFEPQERMNAAVEAATQLLERGKISQEQYTAELVKATQAYDEATDPLYRMKQAMDSQVRTQGLYGVELEKAIYLEQIRQEYAARGLSMYDATTGKLREEVAALVAKNDALRQQQFIQSQLTAVLNPILDQNQEILSQQAVYTELERLRQNDLIREEDYQRAKAALWVKYNEAKLQTTADFFGTLASVTKKGHGVVGAISKAAAVAEATINGYLAVQKALASAPPPFNYIAAAAVAIKTGAQVAGIISTNVGSYATGGQFTVAGGRAGVDTNNINMNVTRGERVTIETPKQQRETDAALAGGGTPAVDARTKVVNLFDEKSFIGAMDSDEGERVIMNIIKRNPDGIAAAIGR